MSPRDRTRLEAIARGIADGSYRFAPVVHPERGADWPPGWRPAEQQRRAPVHPRVLEALAKGRKAEALRKADAKFKRAGALSASDAARINGQKSAASMRHRDRMPEMMQTRKAA